MFVVLVGQRPHHAGPRTWLIRHGTDGVHAADHALALVHGALRQFRRGHGRGRGKAQADTLREYAGPSTMAKQAGRATGATRSRSPPASSCARGIWCSCEAGRLIPGDGEVDRRRRLGRRIGHHRRIRAGHPRVRRRPSRGHRRHERALRLDRHPDHRQPRRDVPRPDDRAGRGRRAAEDAERDRAHILLSGLTIIFLLAVVTLQPFAIYSGTPSASITGARRAAGLPHPDDDRRPALGDRHRRHGPPDPAERDRHERPRRRGGGRRQHAAARQDRHDHARQPAGRRVHPGAAA